MNLRGISAAVVVGIALAGCSASGSDTAETTPADTASSAAADTLDATVTFQILNENGRGLAPFARLIDAQVSDTDCEGIGPFSFMREGAAVTIAGPDGKTVALSRLPVGEDTRNGSARPIECTYVVPFPGVPVFDFYTVSVEGGDQLNVTEQELRAGLVVPLPPSRS